MAGDLFFDCLVLLGFGSWCCGFLGGLGVGWVAGDYNSFLPSLCKKLPSSL